VCNCNLQLWLLHRNPSTLGADFCNAFPLVKRDCDLSHHNPNLAWGQFFNTRISTFCEVRLRFIASQPWLAWGWFFNMTHLRYAIYEMQGPMAACHLALPHSLKSLATSSFPAICPSQTRTLTCSNFFIWARIQVSFAPLESRWWALRSEAKFIKILTLWVLSLIFST